MRASTSSGVGDFDDWNVGKGGRTKDVADAVALAETNIMKVLFKQKELKSVLRAVWATWVRTEKNKRGRNKRR
jgi:hypothetical protein